MGEITGGISEESEGVQKRELFRSANAWRGRIPAAWRHSGYKNPRGQRPRAGPETLPVQCLSRRRRVQRGCNPRRAQGDFAATYRADAGGASCASPSSLCRKNRPNPGGSTFWLLLPCTPSFTRIRCKTSATVAFISVRALYFTPGS